MNPGPLGEKLERYLCAMQPPPVFRTLFHSGEHLNGVAIRNSTANVKKCGFEFKTCEVQVLKLVDRYLE